MEKMSRPFNIKKVYPLGFGSCRLSIAVPKNFNYLNKNSIDSLKIATSYPNILEKYLKINQLNSEIIFLSGSVEIAPQLLLSELICDLVSSGKTLQDNNLKEVETIFHSEAVLIMNSTNLIEEKYKFFKNIFNQFELSII